MWTFNLRERETKLDFVAGKIDFILEQTEREKKGIEKKSCLLSSCLVDREH